ncbi:glycerophosphodiester phosphodiesterase family protein [Corynebacterium sp. HS2168-gen11]|uniref:glycerophosphodiester phosphodiesterase family protein n=1 Tax=Corynebacterium sp. HS2168-gen11 TaxID=2974027 RepID=UPI00216AFECE|nr:glycerophosphodiester phosphodiesterase family protein [Corynebacterium sp. HS2168-gen11]MCS4536014.1 glycerophosphodiester phosphodiesterase [Corynebacterium sp. HS2168-gen11]
MNTYPLPVFDAQSHRGGRGQFTEESAYAFRRSLEMGVSTLELDIVLTRDNVPAVWHDPVLLAEKCSSHIGELVHDLTFEQLQTVPCAKQLKEFPEAYVVPDNRIIQLSEVFELARDYDVHFNIETKIEAVNPEMCATPEQFVDAIFTPIFEYGLEEKVMIQSFDWRTFDLVHAIDPRIPLVALWDTTTWYPGTPWGPYHEDILEAALEHHIKVLSPDFHLVDAQLITRAHAYDMVVVPWTVNEPADITRLMDLGVDGMISDYPTRLLQLATEHPMVPFPAA